MREPEMAIIARLMSRVAEKPSSDSALAKVGKEALLLCSQFPVSDHFTIPSKPKPHYLADASSAEGLSAG